MPVPYTFGTATTSIPLSNLDANFNTPVTIGSTTVGLGNTTTTLAGLSNVSTTLLVATTANITTQNVTTSNLTNLTVTNDASISGLTVGKGTSALATNTALGASALVGVNTGFGNNAAVGYNAMAANTSGASNAGFGAYALLANTTGNSNAALGYNALLGNTTGSQNTGLGQDALRSNTTASNNTAVGYQAGYSNTTGAQNTAMGDQAGYSNTTGTRRITIGLQASINSTGNDITAVGNGAIRGGSGNNNQGFGNNSGYSLTTGNGNLFLGMQAGYEVTTANGNTFVGPNWNTDGAGYAMTTGGNNTILGPYTGNMDSYDMRTLSNRVVLADGAGLRQLTMYNTGTVALASAVPVAGTGITFPATQNASSDANTLDDYEEGSWTPTDASGAGLSFSNTSGNCLYTKIGRTVTITFRLTYPSTANGNTAVVGGLPFAAADTSVNTQSICFGEQNLSAGAMALIQDANTTFIFLTTNGTSVTVLGNSTLSTKDFRGTATYQAAA